MAPPVPKEIVVDVKEIDGVKPIDHPVRYQQYLRSTCLTPKERCFVEDEYPWRRVCLRCYRPSRLRMHFRSQRSHGYKSRLSKDESFETISECFRCPRQIMDVKPARDCRRCLEVFLENEEEINNAVSVDILSFEKFE